MCHRRPHRAQVRADEPRQALPSSQQRQGLGGCSAPGGECVGVLGAEPRPEPCVPWATLLWGLGQGQGAQLVAARLWMLTAAGLGRAQPGGGRAVVLGAASTSHHQTEGLSGVRQKLLLFPLGCCHLSSVCLVSCAAGAVPGPGGAALGHGGAGPRLRLLPGPFPWDPAPVSRRRPRSCTSRAGSPL